MVQTYRAWKYVVHTEHLKLAEVEIYLSPDGRQRKEVYSWFDNESEFYDTAEELLAVIDAGEDMTPDEVQLLESSHAALIIKSLRRIAETEIRWNENAND